jgi:hypothetical protein
MFMFLLMMYVLYRFLHRMMLGYPYGRYAYRPLPRPMFLFGPFYRRSGPMMFGPMRSPMCCHGPHHGRRF